MIPPEIQALSNPDSHRKKRLLPAHAEVAEALQCPDYC
jgi:hypothetical protein